MSGLPKERIALEVSLISPSDTPFQVTWLIIISLFHDKMFLVYLLLCPDLSLSAHGPAVIHVEGLRCHPSISKLHLVPVRHIALKRCVSHYIVKLERVPLVCGTLTQVLLQRVVLAVILRVDRLQTAGRATDISLVDLSVAKNAVVQYAHWLSVVVSRFTESLHRCLTFHKVARLNIK